VNVRRKDPESGPGSAQQSLPRAVVVLAVVLAAALRIAWALRHGQVMDQEGVEYARIAQNLLAGRGYVGMFNNGTQLNFPPLYPLMIAAVSLLVGSAETAARTINIVFGAALVIPMVKIAQRLYGRRVAMGVAAIVVFHPFLIAGAASTYAEGPYLTLLVCGLLCLIVWEDEHRTATSIWAGVFFGLAYLVRPEAFVMVGAFTAVLLAAAIFTRRRTFLSGAIGLAGTFALVAAPNVAFLTVSTGKLRIEAKGALAYAWGQRINAGMPYTEAAEGVGQDLSEQGVFMRPNLDVINSTHYTIREYATYLLKAARRNVGQIHDTIVAEPAFGSPILFALIVIAFFAAPWGRRRLLLDGVLVATAGMIVFVLFTVQALWLRYFYSLLGLFLLWGAKGADDLGSWTRDTITALTDRPRVRQWAGELAKWGPIVAVLLLSLRTMPDVSQFKESELPERSAAGRWLATQSSQHKWIMDSGLQVAYYAGGDLIFLPDATPDVALRYIAKRNPDYIVLHSIAKAVLPYTAQWFDNGIPDKRATLIYDQGTPPGDRIKIYRWSKGPP
jgi:Dolichyl-phosphate-mannose-protein mannosyltransferase